MPYWLWLRLHYWGCKLCQKSFMKLTPEINVTTFLLRRCLGGLHLGIIKGEVSLYHWPPVWLVCITLFLQIKTKIVSSHTADCKPVKQEVNSTVILPPLVFPACTIHIIYLWVYCCCYASFCNVIYTSS
jgi:hypothetical protein